MSARLLRMTLAVVGFWCGCATPPTARALAGDEQPETAIELKARIEAAIQTDTAASHNEALALLNRLGKRYGDQATRDAIGFTELAAQTVGARDAFFRKAVQRSIYGKMQKLIEAKAREKKPVPPAAADPAKGPVPGTLAAARQWLSRDLPKLLWEGVAAELELKAEEMDRYWKERPGKNIRAAIYGTGSFVVIAGKRMEQHKDPVKPATEEEWWERLADRPIDRAKWLTAYFVESSGLFEVVRIDASEECGPCAGRGVQILADKAGTQLQTICAACNGAAKVRKVLYR